MAAPVTEQDVTDYLGIDYVDEMTTRNIQRLINVSDAYLAASLGASYPSDDPRAKELALAVIADLYNYRGTTEQNYSTKIGANTKKLIIDFSTQLRMEMRISADQSTDIN